MTTKLTHEERETALETMEGWSLVADRDAIEKTFLFEDFSEAWDFMSRVAEEADEMDHHPEWFNVWNRVEVTLTTHDCGGVSEKDIALARFMDAHLS
jgi:4a-hydroxytetrahydrobiopterin dehydratase